MQGVHRYTSSQIPQNLNFNADCFPILWSFCPGEFNCNTGNNKVLCYIKADCFQICVAAVPLGLIVIPVTTRCCAIRSTSRPPKSRRSRTGALRRATACCGSTARTSWLCCKIQQVRMAHYISLVLVWFNWSILWLITFVCEFHPCHSCVSCMKISWSTSQN